VNPLIRRTHLLLCLLAVPAWSVDPVTRHQARFADFESGTGVGISLSSDGELALGPVLTPLAEVDARRIWTLAADDADLWAGTGDEGRIFRLAGKEAEPRLLFDSPEVGVHALEPVAGGLFAGTSPDGLVYRLAPNGEVASETASGSRYVWDLALDRRGRLLVAAGGPARVLRIAGDQVDTLFHGRTGDHVRALAGAGSRWYAGTAVSGTGEDSPSPQARARIYELTGSGARLVIETDAEEVTHLVAVGDTLFAALVATPPAAQGGSPESLATLLRVDPGGGSYPLWRGPGVWGGLADGGDGWLAAVLREPAQVLRVHTAGRLAERLAAADSLSPNALLLRDGDWIVGDGLTGRLSRLTPSAADSGFFDARVEDLGSHGHWGTVEWEASIPERTRLFLRTRSGNTSTPDETWSEWSERITESGTAIPSPPARYLQYRLVLSSRDPERTPRVRRVSMAARPTNLPPRISEVTTFAYRGNPQGQGPPPPPQNGPRDGNRGLPRSKSLRLVRWQAQDPNGDELSYRVYLRGEDQREWKLVEDRIAQATLFWDTESMPEGTTQLRVVASDAPDNPLELALEDDYVSAPFPIDNTPPRVRLTASREDGGILLRAEIEDAVTAVHGARYSVDYDDAGTRLAPDDGVFDGRRESATFRAQDLEPGEHVISVQAWDALDNVGVARVLVEVE
jgi:hypothetical protein